MTKLRESAKDEECTLNIAGVCNYNPATTVLCHLRFGGFGGTSLKPDDLVAVYGCSDCHTVIDLHDKQRALSREDWNFYALRALARTHLRMAERGILTVRKSA